MSFRCSHSSGSGAPAHGKSHSFIVPPPEEASAEKKNKQRDARVMYFCLGCEESERDGWLHATKAQTWGAFPVSRSALRVRLDREHRSPWANVFTVTQGPG